MSLPHTSPTSPAPAVRLIELDGLRGLAAVVVVIHHLMLLSPTLAAVGARPGVVPTGTLDKLLVLSPLHLLWSGHEAVLIFFVLSGVALVYPVARRHAQSRRFDWVDYAPRRFVRLWLPAAVATGATAATVVLIPRSGDPALGEWITAHRPGLAVVPLARQILLLPRYAYHNSVLWSLHAEAAFSILLPLVVLVVALAARWRAWWVPALAGIAVPVVTGDVGTGLYLPVFAVGAALGWRWGHEAAPVPATARRWATPASALCLAALTVSWWPGMDSDAGQRLGGGVTLAAAAGLVVLVVRAGAMRALLRSRAVQYLGLMSFSLYLVHEPVIVSLRLATASLSPWVTVLLAPVLAAGLTWAFQRWIEAPSHRLSRRVGRRASAWWHARWPGPAGD